MPDLGGVAEGGNGNGTAVALDVDHLDGLGGDVLRQALDGARVRVLDCLPDVEGAIQWLVAAARRDIMIVRDPSPRTRHFLAFDDDRHRSATRAITRRAIRLRTAYDARVLALPRALSVMTARRDAGEESRVVSNAPASLFIADDLGAVVDFTSIDSSGAGSIVVEEPRILAALTQLAEKEWSSGIEVAGHANPLESDGAYVLTLLAAGANDATIATQTGLSQRTVERRIQALLQRCGATTRFQAGVVAAQRGWI